MALISCPECQKEISDSAKSCPNCGVKIKKKRKPIKKFHIITILTMAMLIIGMISAYFAMQLSEVEKNQVIRINNSIENELTKQLDNDNKESLVKAIDDVNAIIGIYDKLKWKQKIRVNGYSDINRKKDDAQKMINNIDTNSVKKVIDIINNIGEVTLDSRESIEKAEKAYSELPEELISRVDNAGKIEEANDTYNKLVEEDTKKKNEQLVLEIISLIDNLGTIDDSKDTENKITSIKKKYNLLPSDMQVGVSNYSAFLEKEKTYSELRKQNDNYNDAVKLIKEGELNNALKILNKLPDKYSVKGEKVSALKKKINNSAWVKLCGKWTSTSGQMRVTQVWDYDGSSEWWYYDFKKGDYYIDVKCGLKENGKIKVTVNGDIPIYTQYSTISEGVKQSLYSVSFSKNVNGMGTIRIDKYTTLTLSSSGISINYDFINPNESMNFTYKYTTHMRLGKRIKKY